MLSQPAAVRSPALFDPLASSTPSPSATTSATSSARRRLSGIINLRSYTSNSLLSSRESSSARNPSNRHSIHGAIFRSSSIRGNSSTTRARSTSRPPNPSQEESALAATFSDALNITSDDYLAEPLSITLDTTIVDPIPRPDQNATRNRSSSPDTRRFSSRFCESAALALLQERLESNSSPSPEPPAAPPTERADMTRARSATLGTLSEMSAADALPSIRLSAFFDPRSTRPSLSFTPVSRTLPTGKETIKVGRYSERESNHAPVPTNSPSAAPVGFKSKVVSRRHCEFWHEQGKWFIKDVKSSSGTFLNHIRLSAPATESKPYPINDGDIVQLGIDFKGGEEMIYRCVKMRIELNRGWQAKPNAFNMNTHKRLRDLTSTGAASSSGSAHAQDCSICLNAIAPCQSLFVAPCSHTWHFKCIREMLHGPSWPIFICPNCRATADLDAEVDEPSEEWQQLPEEILEEKAEEVLPPESNAHRSSGSQARVDHLTRSADQAESGDVTIHLGSTTTPQTPAGASRHAPSDPMPIRSTSRRRTPSPSQNGLPNIQEGPITPRNDAGPWVFDGNPARVSQETTRRNAMGSLNAAAQAQAGSNQI